MSFLNKIRDFKDGGFDRVSDKVVGKLNEKLSGIKLPTLQMEHKPNNSMIIIAIVVLALFFCKKCFK